MANGTHDGTIVVLSGGLSHERDVSLRSGRRVTQALRQQGRTVVEADLTAALPALLKELDRPVVIPMLHGGAGEDGAAREVLTLLGVPFVGSDGPHSRIAFDKALAHVHVREAGVAVPRQWNLPHDMFREVGAGTLTDAVVRDLELPIMVKPARSGSFLGCTVVEDAGDLPAAMVDAYAYGDVAILQEFIAGPEYSVAVIDTGDGPRALPPIGIRPVDGVFDFTARYTAGQTKFSFPGHVDDELTGQLQEAALAAHSALGLRDISRSDLIVRDGVPVFLEISVAPGMTETSTFPLSVEHAGEDVGILLVQLVDAAAARGAC